MKESKRNIDKDISGLNNNDRYVANVNFIFTIEQDNTIKSILPHKQTEIGSRSFGVIGLREISRVTQEEVAKNENFEKEAVLTMKEVKNSFVFKDSS